MSFPTDATRRAKAAMADLDVALWFELNALQERYVATIDDDRLEDWPALFIEDGVYEIVSRENAEQGLPVGIVHCFGAAMMRDRIVSLRNANVFERHFYRHLTSGLQFERLADGAIAMRTSYVVVQIRADGSPFLFQTGVYRDEVVLTDEGWRYRAKRAIYDSPIIQTLLVIPV